MNIDEIKQRIKSRQTPNITEYPLPTFPTQSQKVQESEQQVNLDIFEDSDSEDEIEPQSLSWEPGKKDSIKKITALTNDLNDDVYDWRRTTVKGRRSRLAFGRFLISEIQSEL